MWRNQWQRDGEEIEAKMVVGGEKQHSSENINSSKQQYQRITSVMAKSTSS